MRPQLNVDEYISDICGFYRLDEKFLRAFLRHAKFPDNFAELLVKGTPNYTLPLYNEYYLSHLTGTLETVAEISCTYVDKTKEGFFIDPVISIFDRDYHAYRDLFKTFEIRGDLEKSCITGLDALGFLGLLAPYFTRLKPKVMAILYGPEVFKGKPCLQFSHLKASVLGKELEGMFNGDYFEDTDFPQWDFPDFKSRLLSKSALIEDLHDIAGVGMFPDMAPRNASKFEYVRAIAAQLCFGMHISRGDQRKSLVGVLWGLENLSMALSIHGDKYLETVPFRVKREVTDILKLL